MEHIQFTPGDGVEYTILVSKLSEEQNLWFYGFGLNGTTIHGWVGHHMNNHHKLEHMNYFCEKMGFTKDGYDECAAFVIYCHLFNASPKGMPQGGVDALARNWRFDWQRQLDWQRQVGNLPTL